MEDALLVNVQGSLATITINRPEQRNAISLDMWDSIARVVRELEAREDVRAITFTGAGEEAFSAGADIGRFAK
ncbi:MAG: enoyl-CoA hydratase/isomerase family protein, partial [Nitrospinota bacterium]